MATFPELTSAGVEKYSSAALENSKVVNARQSILYGFDGRNTDNANAIWVMVFDAISLPANGAFPVIIIGVPPAGSGATAANGNFGYSPGAGTYGIKFKLGIVIAASTTDSTLTISATNKTQFHVDFASEDGLASN